MPKTLPRRFTLHSASITRQRDTTILWAVVLNTYRARAVMWVLRSSNCSIEKLALALCLSASVLLCFSNSALAQTRHLDLNPVVSGLSLPVLLTNAHDGSGRRYIVEQPGRI